MSLKWTKGIDHDLQQRNRTEGWHFGHFHKFHDYVCLNLPLPSLQEACSWPWSLSMQTIFSVVLQLHLTLGRDISPAKPIKFSGQSYNWARCCWESIFEFALHEMMICCEATVLTTHLVRTFRVTPVTWCVSACSLWCSGVFQSSCTSYVEDRVRNLLRLWDPCNFFYWKLSGVGKLTTLWRPGFCSSEIAIGLLGALSWDLRVNWGACWAHNPLQMPACSARCISLRHPSILAISRHLEDTSQIISNYLKCTHWSRRQQKWLLLLDAFRITNPRCDAEKA